MSTSPEVRAYRTAWAARRRKLLAYGRWEPQQYVDPAPVREHIANLRAAGMSLKSIAYMAGEHVGHLGRLVYPNHRDYSTKMDPDRAARYLAIRLDIDKLPPHALIDPTGTRRRLEALMSIGWSQGHIGQRLSTSRQHISRIRSSEHVSASTAIRVRDLYDELWNTPGPEVRAVNKAAREGMAPPAAWDDDTIDDPNAQPADMGEERTGVAERIEDVEWLLEHEPHATLHQLAERLGLIPSTLHTSLIRAGRDDLRARLSDNAEIAGFTVNRRQTA